MHVYCWDLDRTYLATDIHSVRGMVRAAFESAASKRNVPGAAALLRALQEQPNLTSTLVVSGSPTQMRNVLEEKLRLDGIRVDGLILKDNLGNLRRGRLRALRGQLGYKLPQLLAQRLTRGVHVTESLFGDDAEVDALIYVIYAETIAGRVTAEELETMLREGGAYDDQISHALRSLRHLRPKDAVRNIFIRVDRSLPLELFHLLGRPVHVVFSWLQASLILACGGDLSMDGVDAVIDVCRHEEGLAPIELAALLQDSVRRGQVPLALVEEALMSCASLRDCAPIVERAMALLGEPPAPSLPSPERDWIGFLRGSGSDALAGREPRR